MTTILIVDDEPGVRAVLELALSKKGVTVLLASNGQDAIDHFKERSRTINLVLLDVRMPGMTGPETLAGLKQVDPGVSCCFLSGSGDSHKSAELLNLGAAPSFRSQFVTCPSSSAL